MQDSQGMKKNMFRTDLRPALIAGILIGSVLLGLLTTLTILEQFDLIRREELPFYAVALFGIYLLSAGVLLVAYLLRYRRVSAANDAAELMSTEVSDLFRYVVDLPYAIISAQGTVKIVSGSLQEILQYRSPICNVPLSTFCTVSVNSIISYAQNGGPVKDITVNSDGVPIDNSKPMITEIEGRKYSLDCYILRSRGTDYYFVIFRDVTEILALEKKKYEEDPIVAYVVIDSLQELAQYVRVSYRTAVSEIESILKKWAESFGGMLREYEREKYVVVFNRLALDECISNKFNILETVRNVKLGDNSYPVTISMGVGAIKAF